MPKLISKTVTLDEVELATVIAGLRLLQQANGELPQEIEMIATCEGQYAPMTPAEIQTLCDTHYEF